MTELQNTIAMIGLAISFASLVCSTIQCAWTKRGSKDKNSDASKHKADENHDDDEHKK